MGRKAKLQAADLRLAAKLYLSGKETLASLAARFKVGAATVYNSLLRAGISREEIRAIGDRNRALWNARMMDDPAFVELLKTTAREPERCRKISASHKGRKKSPEHRAAIGRAIQRQLANPETRANRLKAARAPERKKKISMSSKLRWRDPLFRQKRAEAMASCFTNPTRPEIKLRKMLDVLEVSYREQVPICGFVADFLVDDTKVIECDGWYWHNLPGVHRRDRQKTATYYQNGYRLLRLTDAQIMEDSARTFDKLWRYLCA